MPEAVIVATGRTPIGRAGKGSLVDVRPDDLLGFALENVVARSGIDPALIDDVVIGCTQQYGEANPMNVTRGATLLAGIPDNVPSTVVNRFCSSSLQAARMAFHAIKADEGDIFLVGGVDSCSRAIPADSENAPEVFHPAFMGDDAICDLYMTMGMTAEKVAELYDVSREEMDHFAQQSQERAVAAQKNGFFDREMLPYTKPNGTVVELDDGPRPSSTYEKLAELPPAFKEDGRVTAGNSCPLNDGAAAFMMMSAAKAEELGVEPVARVLSTGVSGLDPTIMGVGPIEAVRKAVKRAGLTADDIEVLELNEAFASQVIAVARELGIDPFSDRLNPHGGGIALGHPFGATGARMMATLISDLETLDRRIGVETMCVGTGMGLAMVVERL
ncbi:MAG TPA: acetyl-CoA C-acyltransferase [Acidimicrobiales bacterium]|nr:acetyl-CoA C-acyltransferase [Acidimicrobiales bacterium]